MPDLAGSISTFHGGSVGKKKRSVRWDSLTPTQLVKTLRDRDLRVAFAGIQGSDPERALKILRGNVRVIACDQHANNALLLDRGNALTKFPRLMPEVIALTHILAQNKFGNYVLQSAIDLSYSKKDERSLEAIKKVLLQNFEQFAVHEIANFSIRKFIEHGDQEIINRVAVTIKLIADTGHGNHVVQDTLRQLPDPNSPARMQIVQSVYDIAPTISNSKFGAHVIQALTNRELCDERLFANMKPVVPALCNHENGNHVIRKIIGAGSEAMLNECIMVGDRLIQNKWGQCVLRFISRTIDSKSPYFAQLMDVQGINMILSSKQRFQADASRRNNFANRASIEMNMPPRNASITPVRRESPVDMRIGSTRWMENRRSSGTMRMNFAMRSMAQLQLGQPPRGLPSNRFSNAFGTVGSPERKRKVFVNSRFRKRNQSAVLSKALLPKTKKDSRSEVPSEDSTPSSPALNPRSGNASQSSSARVSSLRFSARAATPVDLEAPELCSSSPAPSLVSEGGLRRTPGRLSPMIKSVGESPRRPEPLRL